MAHIDAFSPARSRAALRLGVLSDFEIGERQQKIL